MFSLVNWGLWFSREKRIAERIVIEPEELKCSAVSHVGEKERTGNLVSIAAAEQFPGDYSYISSCTKIIP